MSDPELEVYEGDVDEDVERTGAAEAMPESVDVVEPKVAAARAPAARQVAAAQDDDETDKISCMVCGARIDYPKYLVDAIRRWNRAEAELGTKTEKDPYPHQPELIGNRQIGCCPGECELKYRAYLEQLAQQRLATTDMAWKAMREGRLSPEDANWLRGQGYGRDVDDYYARQAAGAPKNPPAAAPAEQPAHDRQLELD